MGGNGGQAGNTAGTAETKVTTQTNPNEEENPLLQVLKDKVLPEKETNDPESGLLYFLFDRDCPIRQIEVAFYETEDRQREVIARIEGNPNVRAALVPPSAEALDVDGVPNAVRAPLVWQYLQQHFTPDFQEGDVIFWRRVEFPK